MHSNYDPQDLLCPVRLPEGAKHLRLLDQRALPNEEVWLELDELEAIAQAIETLVVRGAPAIGCAASLGLAVVAKTFSDDESSFRQQAAAAIDRLKNTRPTAVNLFVALREQEQVLAQSELGTPTPELRRRILICALEHAHNDLQSCREIGKYGGPLLPEGSGVLTHCNAGALATAGYGTALGVIRHAHAEGRGIQVFADETRPVLQGARLTAWELMYDKIPVTVIADNMAGALMSAGKVGAVVVGADRIAKNGDVANKIGTFSVAVLCKHHNIPFYVAAPWTTIDLETTVGSKIPIEERNADEVRKHGNDLRAPADVPVWNPAFDVTPAELVTAIVTDRGVFKPNEIAAAGESLTAN